MAVLTVYNHGTTAALGGKPNHNPEIRQAITGWSPAAARRNLKFLYSVRADGLTGDGYAVTLTLRDCPRSHDEWHGLRRRYLERLRRMGCVRSHWVTEWQRRGVPHLHIAVWFPAAENLSQDAHRRSKLRDHWLEAGAADLGSLARAQYVTPITGSVGWFQYVSKHAARGAHHYQRDPNAGPKHWEKTGRLWGYTGDWPRDDAMKFEVSKQALHQYRRILQRWRMADARASGDRSRIRAAKRMLRSNTRTESEVRGVNEWLPIATQTEILFHLTNRGYSIDQSE